MSPERLTQSAGKAVEYREPPVAQPVSLLDELLNREHTPKTGLKAAPPKLEVMPPYRMERDDPALVEALIRSRTSDYPNLPAKEARRMAEADVRGALARKWYSVPRTVPGNKGKHLVTVLCGICQRESCYLTCTFEMPGGRLIERGYRVH